MNKYDEWLKKYKHLTGAHNQKRHGNRGGTQVSHASQATGESEPKFSPAMERVAAGAISRLGDKINGVRYHNEFMIQFNDIKSGTNGVMVDVSGERTKPMRDKAGNAIIGRVSNPTGRDPVITYTDANGVKQTTRRMSEFEPIDEWLSYRKARPVYTPTADDYIPIYKR